jgi:hypothetical protein
VRFVVAIVLFALALVGIGLGVAQRTILAGPSSVSASVTIDSTAPLTVIDGGTLNTFETTQGITVEGDGDIMLATGRTPDVLAWVGKASYNRIGYDPEARRLTSELVVGTEFSTPSPAGSDLWAGEYVGTDVLTRNIKVPRDVSVIIASDGTEPAPAQLSITWPLDNSTPWSGPLILGGVIALLIGLGAFLWALVHARRRRGPRRSSLRVRNPKPPRLKPPKARSGRARTEIEPAVPQRGRRRNVMAVAVLLAVATALSGCAAGGPVAEPSPEVTDEIEAIPTAVSEAQLSRIVAKVVATIADADEARDAELAAARLDGPALALRAANYAIRNADAAIAAVPPIPTDVQIALPQQTADWPRTVFTVVSDADATTAPVALVLSQASPREQYKVVYVITLEASLPDVAPAEVGAPQLDPGIKIGVLAPNELALAYGDILLKGEESEYAALFDSENDDLQAEIGFEFKQSRRASLPGTAAIDFSQAEGEAPIVSFATNDTGQIVAVELHDIETVRPVEAGAAIKPSGAVKALSGKTQSTKGIIATYGLQLLFYVPPLGSDEKIVLLGFSQGLVSAVERP